MPGTAKCSVFPDEMKWEAHSITYGAFLTKVYLKSKKII